MTRRTFRAWGQTCFLAGCFGAFLLVGVASLTQPVYWAAPTAFNVSSIALYSVIAVASLYALWRTFRMGLVVDERGCTIRFLDRRRVIRPWHDIDSISCEMYELRWGIPLYGPVLHARDGEGTLVSAPLTLTGSYRQSVARRRTAMLTDLWTAAVRDRIAQGT